MELPEDSRWVAFELHDGLLQWIVNARMNVDSAIPMLEAERSGTRETESSGVAHRLQSASASLSEALSEGRELIQFLEGASQPSVSDFGSRLSAFLTQVEFDIESAGQKVDSAAICSDCPPLSQRLAWNLLRIAQQAIRNAILHAGPCSIRVGLEVRDTRTLRLTVADDGVGFQVNSQQDSEGHFGLVSMQHRARLIGADLEIESAVGTGTTIRLDLPLAK